MKIFPVILAGGVGTRLWPISRGQFPKQYHSLVSEFSMLQDTILRLNGLKDVCEPTIVCNSDHRFIVAEQLKQINISQSTILLEPIGRNTAPAITAAAFQIMQDKENIDAVLLVLSADHVIHDVIAFHEAINIAKNYVKHGKLATFGIVPTQSNTEYGYIQAEVDNYTSAMNVMSFKEKPSIDLADEYIRENAELTNQNLPINWYWNSGIFMFQAKILIDELSLYDQHIVNSIQDSVIKAKRDFDFIRLEERAFTSSPNISIDYALLEKSNKSIVIPLEVQWSDVGSWASLYEISEKDKNNNVIRGDVIAQKTTNSYVNASHHIIATIGIDNLIVVDTPDAILIADQNNAHEVKSIVEELHILERDEAHLNQKMYRPWGWFESIEVGKNFQVKKLHVSPGAKLSLQKHYKRAEHWVVVSGMATVNINKEIFLLKEGESTYIDIGVVHSLENRTNEALEVIEVQNGYYLGEDDIMRFEDD